MVAPADRRLLAFEYWLGGKNAGLPCPLAKMSGRRAAGASAPSSGSTKPAIEPEGIIPLSLTELSLVRPVLSRGPDFVADTHEGVVRQRAELRRAAAAVAARSAEEAGAGAQRRHTERADQCSLERVPTAPEGHLAVAAALAARRRARRLKQKFGRSAVRSPHELRDEDVSRALLACGAPQGRGAAELWAARLMACAVTPSSAASRGAALHDLVMAHSLLCCYQRARAGTAGQPAFHVAVAQSLEASLGRARQHAAHHVGTAAPSAPGVGDPLSRRWLRSLDAATGRALAGAGMSAVTAVVASCVEAARSHGWIQPVGLHTRCQLGALALLQQPSAPQQGGTAATAAGGPAAAEPFGIGSAAVPGSSAPTQSDDEDICFPALMEAAAAGMAPWPVCMATAAMAAGWLEPKPKPSAEAGSATQAARAEGAQPGTAAPAAASVSSGSPGSVGPLAPPPGAAWPAQAGTTALPTLAAAVFRQGLEPPLPAGFWELVGTESGAAVAGGRSAALLLGQPLRSLQAARKAGAGASAGAGEGGKDGASRSGAGLDGASHVHRLAAAAAAGLAGSEDASDVQAAAALMLVDEPARLSAMRALGGNALHPLAELAAANSARPTAPGSAPAPAPALTPGEEAGPGPAALAHQEGSVVARGVLLVGAELAAGRVAPLASPFPGVVTAKWNPAAAEALKPAGAGEATGGPPAPPSDASSLKRGRSDDATHEDPTGANSAPKRARQ